MVVIPVNRDKDETQDIGEDGRLHCAQRRQGGLVWRSNLQHHDRDNDRDHAIGKPLEPRSAHPSWLHRQIHPRGPARGRWGRASCTSLARALAAQEATIFGADLRWSPASSVTTW